MIKPAEIQQKARATGVRDQQIEKDYILSWILKGIAQHGMDVDFYLNEFETKCECKKLKHTDFPKKLTERLPQYKGRWQSSMNEQIKDLPDFDQVEREVLRHLKNLNLK